MSKYYVNNITYFEQYNKYIVGTDDHEGVNVSESEVRSVNEDVSRLELKDGKIYTTDDRTYKCMCNNKELCNESGCCLNRRETGRSFGI